VNEWDNYENTKEARKKVPEIIEGAFSRKPRNLKASF
jgi:hypothetical protein